MVGNSVIFIVPQRNKHLPIYFLIFVKSTLDSNGLSLGITPKEALFDVQSGTELNIRNTLIKDSKWSGAIYNEGTLKAENICLSIITVLSAKNLYVFFNKTLSKYC